MAMVNATLSDMRIWDIDPGYLARQQLLGEHRELHGLFNILTMNKKGYAKHPETVRWIGHVDALVLRHKQLLCEMALRGYRHQSPLPDSTDMDSWPGEYIDPPARQLELLAGKYSGDGRSGRIPLPDNCQELWAHHKYSVMAHDPNLYRELGPEVAHGKFRNNMNALACLMISTLRKPPEPGHLLNALQHMWGYVQEAGSPPSNIEELLATIQSAAIKEDRIYLLHSTALSELAVWV
ncbi:DUF1722 domain-containing protein [Mariprofundus ferrinatatus]|nr:DUF1722 domain-containing protein [Mariprofundus ferrinatatus]